jgi:hypothetical protein
MHFALAAVVRALLTFLALALLVASASAQQHVRSMALPVTGTTFVSPPESTEARAMDEMLRGTGGRERRWTHQPTLVVITSVLEFAGVLREDYTALDEGLQPTDAQELAADLTAGLGMLTGGRFLAFDGVWYEDAAPGSRVDVMREGQIVVARFRGVREALDGVGFGGRTTLPDGTITSGIVMLDSEYDRADRMRRLLRIHELGHALGYNHVESLQSIMNPTLGSGLTDFDKRVALIAFRQ